MDIKETIKDKIEEIVEKVKNDQEIANKFKADPIKTVEGLLGVDLPDEAIEKIVDGVKAKVQMDNLSDALGGLKGLFGKKD